ncbi:MAG: asparagine synthetase B family protein [Parachlamydiaceae bacterium]
MTSLAGIVYPDLLQVADVLDPMLDIMKHSLKDTKSSHSYKSFQLGCINTSFVANHKKSIFLAIDGKIDNKVELLQEFDLKGGLKQEEILIAGYERKGIQFLKNINGEFAIVLLDQEKNTLYLIRDRIGKKPLYWYQDRSYFLFSSELKSLLTSQIVPQTASEEALSSYLFFGYVPQDLTAIKDVNRLLPAHYLKYSPGHGEAILPYWSYSSYFETDHSFSTQQITDKINHLMTQSVNRCLEGDDRPGCFVSGGLGSATTAFYVANALETEGHPPFSAFNVGFQGQNEDDTTAAQSVAKSLDLNFLSRKINSQNFLQDIVKIAWFLDEPLADPNAVATWNLCKLAAGEVKTVFSGMGSDELLAGHSRYSSAERDRGFLNRLFLLPKPLLNRLLIPLLKNFFRPVAFNLLKISRTNPSQFEYLRNNALFDEKSLAVASPRLSPFADPDTFLHKFHHLNDIPSTVSSYLYLDVKTRLPDCFIFQYSRLTSTYRLDWKTPFLDRHLVEYVAQLPEPEVLHESQTASYLKPLISHVFSPAVFNRPKKTRRRFLSSWMLDPQLFETMQLLTKGTLVETGIISETWLKQQLSDPVTASFSFRYLFAILMLEIWFRLFINRPISLQPPVVSIQELLHEG